MFGGDSDDGAAGDDDMGVEDGASRSLGVCLSSTAHHMGPHTVVDVSDSAGTHHQCLRPVFSLRTTTPCESAQSRPSAPPPFCLTGMLQPERYPSMRSAKSRNVKTLLCSTDGYDDGMDMGPPLSTDDGDSDEEMTDTEPAPNPGCERT